MLPGMRVRRTRDRRPHADPAAPTPLDRPAAAPPAGPTPAAPPRSTAAAHPPTRRAICGWLLAVLALLVAAGASAPAAPARATGAVPTPATVRYRAPVTVPVRLLRPFAAPPQPWAAGHRGVDLALDEGGTVVAPGPGTVTVAGTVVDRGVVTIAHPDGRRSSLEPVAATVVVGQAVASGDPVGTLSGERSHCTPRCLHWGVREGTVYVDPLGLLPGGGPVVLLPDDG
jgi:murein DD-endopeptidase MepM/ murein hydrolase activator NlpD